MNYQDAINGVLANPAVSFAVKEALKRFNERDICDALNDAELLLDLLKMKYEQTAGVAA